MAEVKLTFSGSNEALKRAALESAAALERLQQTGQSLTAETGKAQAAAERFIESLKREALQVTLGEQAIRRYQLEKANLTEAARREATTLMDAIDGHKRHTEAMDRAGRMAESVGRKIGGLVSAAATAGAALGVVMFKDIIAKTTEAEQSLVRFESTLRATGYAAGWTREELEAMVREFRGKTLFDDEKLRDALSALLKFRSIGGPALRDALQATVDLAAHFGTDLAPQAQKVGKALEEPGKNLRGLKDAGVAFNEEQTKMLQKMVDVGQKAEAQAIIFEKLQKGVGGTAEAMNTGMSKSVTSLSRAWDDLLKTIGKSDGFFTKTVSALTTVADVLNDLSAQVDGTSNRFAKFFTSREFLRSGLAGPAGFIASYLVGDEEPESAPTNRRRGRVQPVVGDRQRADAGARAREEEEAAERKAKAAASQAKALEKVRLEYERTQKAAESWIAALENEVATLGMAEHEKKLYVAEQQASKLRTQEERDAFMDRAKAAAAAIEANRKLMAQQKEENEENERRFAEREKFNKSLEAGTEALQRELDALIKHNDEFGKSREMIERETLAKMENALATMEVTSATEKERAELEKRIDLQRRLIDEGARADVLKAGKKEADELARAYERATDQIEQSLVDAIMRGGKGGRDILEGLFKNLVLRPLVEMSVNAGMQMMGMGPQGGQAGGRGGISLPGGVPGGFTGMLGSGISTVGGWLGSAGMAEFGAGMAGTFMGPTMAGSAAGLGAMAAQAIPYIGWAIAAAQILRSVFDDGPENPRVQLAFGRGGVNTNLGQIGFAQNQGGIDTAAAEQYFRTVTGLFNPITSRLGDDAMARVQGRLAGASQREFAFPEGDATAQGQILNETLRQIGIAVFEEVNPALADFLETLEATDDRIPNLVQGFIALTDAGAEIDRVIMQISDDVMGPLRAQLDALETQQERARGAFDAALAGDDPMAIAQAQQDLMAAVLQRYQAEMQMVRDLMAAIEQVQQQAYEFSLQMAQRINSVGGSIDTGAIAMGRATTIRGNLSTDPGRRAGQIQDYVGAIDTWYAARRAEIEARMDREAEAAARANAAYTAGLQAQQAINAARISGLQQELALTQQWQGMLDRTTQIIDQMRLTAVNPLAASGRLGLAEGDADLARVAYQSATGGARPEAAGRYVDALQRQLGLLGDVYQRPSMEYQQGYNDIIRQLTEVQGEARTEAERALDIQAEIERLTRMQNDLTERIQYSSAATAEATAQSSAELDALDEQARGYYEWARDEGEAAFAEQERRHREQLEAITGGMEPTLYMAQRQAETVAVLKEIQKAIATALATWGEQGAGGNGDGSAGGGRPSPDSEQKIVLEVDGQVLGSVMVPAIDKRIRQSGTVIKRAIANA